MKTQCPLALLLLFVPATSISQTYHSPAEIIKILTDSKITYEIGLLEAKEIEEVPHRPELQHGFYLKTLPDGSRVVTDYDEDFKDNEQYTQLSDEAENAFQEDRMSEAREIYLKILGIAPGHSQIMTYIGQTYDSEGNDSLAVAWYRRAIATNYQDYMAHWFLADASEMAGQADTALKEILIARILNRNNPRLFESLDRILKNQGIEYPEWTFTPRCEVSVLEDGKVIVNYDEYRPEWLPYALCKALWAGEPGYSESMTEESGEYPLIVEEKECVVNVLIGMENSGQKTDDPSLQAARRALDEKLFSEYIAYDVVLPKVPPLAFFMSEATLKSISHYILTVKCKKL